MRNTVPDEQKAYEALSKLLEQAGQNTKQARCVANLLLAWYDATIFDSWDPVDIWSVDDTTGSDMIAVLHLIKESHTYIDELERVIKLAIVCVSFFD